ncbi:MAG: hypothetical protein HY700_20280 [Gemmatimonadetes bacterium]|nr:hypothetical protein [Gemmatimonadota bacterium]
MGLWLAACSRPAATKTEPAPRPPEDSLPAVPPFRPEPRPILEPARVITASANINVDSLLATLSVRQKVGQLIMPWLLGNYAAYDAEDYDAAKYWIDSLEIGGILISIGSPIDVATRLNTLQRRSTLPLLVGADLEWGAAMRLIGATAFPMAMGIGATGRDEDAYELGRITALEARAVGIHLTFSPVVDVNNNPLNPIINTRSFGEDPRAVARLAAAYIRGAQEHGVFATAKHFPGHGDTQTDTHIDVPVVPSCWSRLDTLELIPFRAAVNAGVTMTMTAHVALPCLTPGDTTPATLSPLVMTGMLRDSLRFSGTVVTDALSMGAIVRKYGPGEAAIRAFLGGSDLLLDPSDVAGTFRAMVAAVESGRISPDRLDLSVRRMLELKQRAGLFERRTVELDSVPAVVGRRESQAVADDVAARSLTLVQRGGDALDTFRGSRGRVAMVLYAEETNLGIGNTLIREMRIAGDTITPFRLYPASGALSYDSARAIVARSPRALFATSVRFIAGRGIISMPDSLANLMLVVSRQKPTMLASFGSPYLLAQLPGYAGGYLLAWSDAPSTERAVGRALSAGALITGTLPITLSPLLPRGYGVIIESTKPH